MVELQNFLNAPRTCMSNCCCMPSVVTDEPCSIEYFWFQLLNWLSVNMTRIVTLACLVLQKND